MVRICFVCLGNICRSPTAEAVMRHLVREHGLDHAIEVDSAGTGDWHVGEPADERSAATARKRGMSLDGITARQFRREDFARFDYVVAVDVSNKTKLERMAPHDARTKVTLLRDFDPASRGLDVPDPYYGGPDGFEHVFDVVEAACRELLAHVRRTHGV